MNSLQSILDNPAIILMSHIIGLAGLVWGYILYRKSRRLKEPCWSVRTITLIEGYRASLSDLAGDLEVLFGGKRVENLAVSRLVFWNQGSDPIDRSDIAPKSPLRVVAKDSALLAARVLQTNHEPCDFQVQLDQEGSYIQLDLAFCDFAQGVVLQIVHTGTGTDDICLEGKIIGAGPLVKKDIIPPTLLPTVKASIPAGAAMILVGSIQPKMVVDPLLIGLGFILLFGGALVGVRHWQNRLPRGLDLFEASQLR